MAELRCSDGKVINISKETEKELREAFSEPEWKFGDIIETEGGCKRIVLYNKNGELRGIWSDQNNDGENGMGQTLNHFCYSRGYKKTGNIFEEK